MHEVSQLQGHVEDNQKLWRGHLVRRHICSPDPDAFFSVVANR